MGDHIDRMLAEAAHDPAKRQSVNWANCGYTSRYKATRMPTCNNGLGCVACLRAYAEALEARLMATKEACDA